MYMDSVLASTYQYPAAGSSTTNRMYVHSPLRMQPEKGYAIRFSTRPLSQHQHTTTTYHIRQRFCVHHSPTWWTCALDTATYTHPKIQMRHSHLLRFGRTHGNVGKFASFSICIRLSAACSRQHEHMKLIRFCRWVLEAYMWLFKLTERIVGITRLSASPQCDIDIGDGHW